MGGDDFGKQVPKNGDERVRTRDDPTARVSRVDEHVVGEDLAHALPVLRVHRSEVASLELLDGLDVVHEKNLRRLAGTRGGGESGLGTGTSAGTRSGGHPPG